MKINFNVKHDFKNNIINDQEKKEYIILVESIINKIIEISNTEIIEECEITITENFKKEVEDFQKQLDLPIGYTDNLKDETVGITLDYKLNNKTNVNIFINKKILFGLTIVSDFDGITMQQFCINAIHHELMHAYDILSSNGKYEDILSINNDDALKRKLTPISIMIWEEYFADRMASKTYNTDYFKVLYEKICYSQNRIRAIIEVNKQCGSIDKLYKDVSSIIIISLRFTAYRLGKLYNLENDIEISKILEFENKELKNSFLYNIYLELFAELNNLFNNYLQWNNNDFDNINELIRKAYNFFGISLNSSEDGEKLIVSLLSSI